MLREDHIETTDTINQWLKTNLPIQSHEIVKSKKKKIKIRDDFLKEILALNPIYLYLSTEQNLND